MDNSAVGIDHYENFPVASWLCPRPIRPAVAAIYRFARTADDIADEGNATPEERLADLTAYRDDLTAITSGGPPSDRWREVFVPLARAIVQHGLPIAALTDLLSAFEQDVVKHAYRDRTELLDYCRRSANPVGRLLLHLYGVHSGKALQQSDAICTALQLTNFWQDFGRDWRAGRLYVPREVYAPLGATEEQLHRGEPGPLWARVIDECIRVTHERFDRGRAVCDGVTGRLRYELRFTWLGGRRILQRVHERRDRVLFERPTLGIGDVPPLVRGALVWNSAG